MKKNNPHIIEINCNNIKDWDTFHDEFSQVFGFPDFYGRNMNAWIDCMSSLSYPEDGMSKVHCKNGHVIALELCNVKEFKIRYPEQYDAIIKCIAFVNWRLIKDGDRPVLALSYNS